jgi:erythronate-4-phosphate dehydrogenase
MKIVADKNIPYVNEAFSGFGDVLLKAGRDITTDDVRDADILLVRTVTPVNKDLLDNSRVKFIGTATIGFDHVDVDYLEERNIAFSPAAGCNANSVAEYIVAALFVLAERYGLNLQDLTLGVVGVGNVGTKVAEKARILGIEVLLNDPPKARETGDKNYLPLDYILKESDIVSFHVPLTHDGPDTTYRMASHKLFNMMKPGSFIINTSRGAVVDTQALIHALYHGKIKSAVIDVWENEPHISTELLDCIDIGTPHIAGYSREGKINATEILYRAACKIFKKKPKWNPHDLPSPEHSVIELPVNAGDAYAEIGKIIKKAYDIERDDRALRMIFRLPKNERHTYFDRLRNEYPVRREFYNMTVKSNGRYNHTLSTLHKLGFQLNDEHELHETKESQKI